MKSTTDSVIPGPTSATPTASVTAKPSCSPASMAPTPPTPPAPPPEFTRNSPAPHKSSTSSANVNATFSTTDAVVNGLQWAGGMTSPSTWGSATYTPNATTTNTGVFVADNAITCSLLVQNTGINQVTLEKLHFRLQRDSATGGSASQATITLASGNLTASGPGVQALSGQQRSIQLRLRSLHHPHRCHACCR